MINAAPPIATTRKYEELDEAILGDDENLSDPSHLSRKIYSTVGEFSPLPNLRHRRINHLKKPDRLPRTEKQSNSVAIRAFSWMANTRVSIWATVNLLKFSRFCMLLGLPSLDSRSQVDKAVDELSGSLHLSKTIQALSHTTAEWLQERLISLKLHESVNLFLKEEHLTLQTFVDVLLPTVYVNIAKSIKENSSEEGNNEKIAISVVDVLSYIIEIMNAHLPYINARIEAIEKIQDPVRRDKKLRHLFVPFVEDFLAVALPEGLKDLPLLEIPVVSSYFWKSLQKHILPIIFIEIYQQLADPLKDTKKELLSQKPGGKSLVAVAEIAGERAPKVLSGLVFEGNNADIHLNTAEINNLSLLAEILTTHFSLLLKGSDQLKLWLSGWFAEQLSAIGKSTDSYIGQFWKFLGSYLEPILIHIFASMSEMPSSIDAVKGRVPDVLGIIVIRFFSLTSYFFNTNKKTIDDRIHVLGLTGGNPKTDNVLLEIFKPYADDLLRMMGLHDPKVVPVPEFLRKTVVDLLKKIAPGFLLRQYLAITNSHIDDGDHRKRLRSLLLDPKSLEDPNVAIKVISAIHAQGNSVAANMFDKFYQELWQESGTERIAKTIEKMCTVIAEDIEVSMMRHFGLSAQAVLKDSVNPLMRSTATFIKRFVETAILETVVHVSESVESKLVSTPGNHPRSLVAANVMLQLANLFNKGLKGIDQKLNEVAEQYPEDSARYTQEANECFALLAAELHAFGGINPFRHLPLDEMPASESLKEMLWITIKDIALPDLSRRMYSQVTDWQHKLKKSYEELESCYHSTHATWACKVLAQYATDYIKHFLTNSSDETAKLLLASLNHYFKNSKDNGGSLLRSNFSPLEVESENFISKNISAFAAHPELSQIDMWGDLSRYIEAIIAKFLAEISKTIHQVESDNPDFMVDIALKIIKDTTEHFSAVSRVAEEFGEEQPYKIPAAEMLAAFGEKLHDGVPLDPKASEAVKNQQRLEGCFIPMAGKLLELANLSVKDFPFPSLLKEQIGDLLTNEILPLTLMHAFKKLLEPQSRDALMLAFIETLYAAFNGDEPLHKNDAIEEAAVQPDPKRKHLYETCGSLTLELIKLIPDTTVQYIFMKEKVKNMSAEAIGDAMMPYLSRWTLLQMIDTMIYDGLPAFHPSKWEGKNGRETLIPRKAFVRPDGKMELKPVKKFKFDFAGTTVDGEAQNKLQKEEADKLRKQLLDGFTLTISQQLHAKAWAFIKALWHSLQLQLDDFIEGHYPEKGPKIKALVDQIFRKVFFDVFGRIIQFLATPLISAMKYVIEKTLIDRRSQDVIENIQSEVIENLFYKWIDTIFDSLLRLQKRPST